jgi:glycine cleavage system aminomethyltransferase T
MQVQGPQSAAVMQALFGPDVLDIGYYWTGRFQIDGVDVVVSRTGYTGEVGFEIYVQDASRHGVQVWERVWEAGQPYGMQVIGPCHIRRIEAGILAHGCDITFDTTPFEVGMGYDWMVSLDQDADFIGKRALQQIKTDGVRRMLAGVEIGGPRLGSFNDGSMIEPFEVRHDGAPVGEVTSACYSPRLDKNIGFAMVPIEYSEIGIELEVERPEETVPAVVADRVFFKPEHAEQELSATSSNKGA